MALITHFTRKDMERNSIHDEIDASYTIFEKDGKRFIQIDSYGRDERQIPGKKSQTIQLARVGALHLYNILGREFGF